MEVHRLTKEPTCPCYVVTWGTTAIMLDCALDLSTCLNFLPHSPVISAKGSRSTGTGAAGRGLLRGEPHYQIPQFEAVDVSALDVVLISNQRHMLALPYLLEETRFDGKVYASEPVIQFGRQLMLDMAKYRESVPATDGMDTAADLVPAFPSDATDVSLWRPIYDVDSIEKCISQIIPVGNGERVRMVGNTTGEASASGFSLGSCNWTLTNNGEKLVYLSSSYAGPVRHPKPLDPGPIADADVCVVSSLTKFPACRPAKMLRSLCGSIAQTVGQGGCCLIPCHSSGIIVDLIEPVIGHLCAVNLAGVPVFVVSNSAKNSFAYADIYSNWLSDSKASRVYLPEWPFDHDQLTKAGLLSYFSHMSDAFHKAFREPCVVFADCPSLRNGNAIHFLEKWKDKAANSLIIVEPDFPVEQLTAPFQPVSMRTLFYPFDFLLSCQDMTALLRQIKPKNVVIPAQYLGPQDPNPDAPVTAVSYSDGRMHEFATTVRVDVTSRMRRAFVDSELAKTLVPHSVAGDVFVAAVSASVSNRDYEMVLHRKSGASDASVVLGKLHVDKLLAVLSQKSFGSVTLATEGDESVLRVGDQATIRIGKDVTSIHTEDDDDLRTVLRETVLSLLVRL